ncbi:MAG TPA: MarR family winged helix-turn-helix transcriptional regulator, partial [Acidimicrobiales bacterium]|nr:MarR family winged helix-turn-helix transcriptional regulator [Acidimicrobiales bacterium]
QRFGTQHHDGLRAALASLVGTLGVDRPRYLPVVTYGMSVELAPPAHRAAPAGFDPAGLGLSALLSLVLLELTADFERRSPVSLAVSANVLRLAGRTALRLQELRRQAGISREAIAIATGYLDRHGYGVLESSPAPERARTLRLTPKGEQAARTYRAALGAIEAEWAERYGADRIARLRRSLAELVAQRNDTGPLLAEGLAPLPGNWRGARPYLEQTESFLADPALLPHHPVVTHRGGWPDGS